jgi:hypothetical protein
MHRKLGAVSAAVLLLIVLSAPNAVAADDDWEHSLTFYGWLAGIDGTVGVGPLDVQVDFSISDAWNALSNVTKVFMGHYEGTRGRWTIIADYSNLELQSSRATVAGPVTADLTQRFAELSGTYRLGDSTYECEKHDLAVLAGLRYAHIGASFELPGGGSPSRSQSWIDPIIGLTYRTRLADRWQFGARGDLGGFGVGNASDLVSNLLLRFTYESSEHWHFDTGWRWLDYNYETGAGTSRFAYDVTMSGPYFGATYAF